MNINVAGDQKIPSPGPLGVSSNGWDEFRPSDTAPQRARSCPAERDVDPGDEPGAYESHLPDCRFLGSPSTLTGSSNPQRWAAENPKGISSRRSACAWAAFRTKSCSLMTLLRTSPRQKMRAGKLLTGRASRLSRLFWPASPSILRHHPLSIRLFQLGP